MKFSHISSVLDGVPHISKRSGRILYDFIRETHPTRCLELGFAHGAGSNYIAAALEANGRGSLDCVDLELSHDFTPTLEDITARTGLESRINIFREKDSYNWYLKKKIAENTVNNSCKPIYDFCFIDGSKNWTIDGMAFFLADKLMKPNGWFLFDDYDWSYAAREKQTGRDSTDGVAHQTLSADQREEPNVKAIFEYLVVQHPDYSNFCVQDDSWAWACKRPGDKQIKHSRKSKLTSGFRAWKANAL